MFPQQDQSKHILRDIIYNFPSLYHYIFLPDIYPVESNLIKGIHDLINNYILKFKKISTFFENYTKFKRFSFQFLVMSNQLDNLYQQIHYSITYLLFRNQSRNINLTSYYYKKLLDSNNLDSIHKDQLKQERLHLLNILQH